MRFRKTLTFLMLVTALVFALPAWAEQKSVGASGAGPRPNAVRPYVACAAAVLTPPGVSQKFVAPTFRSARADVAASLPRHGGVKPPLRYAALTGGATTATSAKPFTQEQVVSMVRDGFGDESGAKLIEQRGIDFAPSEDFLQTLKAAGASEAFLNALRAAVAPGLSPAGNVAPTLRSAHADLKVSATTAASEPATTKKPLNQVQVFALLAGQVPSHRVTMLVQERGIDFEPTDDYLQQVRLAGGEDELIRALKSAKVTKPATVDPAAQARQAEVLQHAARGAELAEKGHYAEAEQEFRAALQLDPQNADLFVGLGSAMLNQKRYDEAESVARGWLRLNPNNAGGHTILGGALLMKGDSDGAITEYREALRLDPSDTGKYNSLGVALEGKGDWDGAIAEFREVLRLNPNDEMQHVILGVALDGKGDVDGAIAEYREALRLNPNLAEAYVYLGSALAKKGDWDAVISEERAALRLNPNDPEAHAYLGVGLEKKGDRHGALKEYLTAHALAPRDAKYKYNYERMLRQVNQ